MEQKTMILEIDNLGLAAYMKMNGSKLIRVDGKKFVFEESDGMSEEEWRIKYFNSCCFRHDTELMMLRKLVSRQR